MRLSRNAAYEWNLFAGICTNVFDHISFPFLSLIAVVSWDELPGETPNLGRQIKSAIHISAITDIAANCACPVSFL